MSGKHLDPDETPRSAASHLGLYCLLRPVCPITYGKYVIIIWYVLFVDSVTKAVSDADRKRIEEFEKSELNLKHEISKLKVRDCQQGSR